MNAIPKAKPLGMKGFNLGNKAANKAAWLRMRRQSPLLSSRKEVEH